MKHYQKAGLTLLLSGSLAISTLFSSLAATWDSGPAFDSQFGGSASGTTTAPSAAPTDNIPVVEQLPEGTTVITNDTTGAGTEGDASILEEKDIVAEASGYTGSVLSVPQRIPRLQTTVLPVDSGVWSSPYVNDQTISADGKPFCIVSTFLEGIHGDLLYRVYTSTGGWTRWVMNGQQTDFPSSRPAIEAVEYRFNGPVADEYDLYYMATLEDGTQTGWAKNGQACGSMATGHYITSYRLYYCLKGQDPGLSTANTLTAAHADGIQYVDGVLRYIDGTGSNHTGWGWLGNDRYYFIDSYPVTGWQYIDGYKYYFGEDGKLVSDVESLLAGGPYEIHINKEMNCMTIFAADGGNGYIIPVKSFLTSTGDDTPTGTFHVPEKFRWRLMIHDVWTQYATRINSGYPILIHSIIFSANNPYTVWASTYNNLGIARSAGCIRLSTGDAKWVYDHCPVGTTIKIYNSKYAGPFERPCIAKEIPFEQTWDPTDPDVTAEGIAAETARIKAQFGES